MINDIHTDSILIDTTFLAHNAPECGVRLFSNPDGLGYVLEWTDFVANDWREEFRDLSSALARLALLAYCAATDWNSSFADESDKFRTEWLTFARKSTF